MTSPSVYEQEEQALSTRPRGGGGGDYVWVKIPTPAGVGQSLFKKLRIVQRLKWANGVPTNEPYPKFWTRVEEHQVLINGEEKRAICPDDHDAADWKSRATCPLCLLKMELLATKNEAYKAAWEHLGTKVKCYCNVIELDNHAVHWKQSPDGQWAVRPSVWGYGSEVHKAIMSICRRKNAGVEDWKIGRNLEIEKKRTRPDKFGIEYRVGDDDSSQVPDGLMPVVAGAWDLEALGTPTPIETLRSMAVACDPRPKGSSSYSAAGGPPTSYGAPATATYTAPPAPVAAPAPGPPPAAPAIPASGVTYHYAGPQGGTVEGLDAYTVGRHVLANPAGQHNVWTPAQGSLWMEARQVPEIVAAINAMTLKPAAPPPAPGAPPPGYGGVPQGNYATPPAPPGPPAPPAGPGGPPAAPYGGPPPVAQGGPPPAPATAGGPPPTVGPPPAPGAF